MEPWMLFAQLRRNVFWTRGTQNIKYNFRLGYSMSCFVPGDHMSCFVPGDHMSFLFLIVT